MRLQRQRRLNHRLGEIAVVTRYGCPFGFASNPGLTAVLNFEALMVKSEGKSWKLHWFTKTKHQYKESALYTEEKAREYFVSMTKAGYACELVHYKIKEFKAEYTDGKSRTVFHIAEELSRESNDRWTVIIKLHKRNKIRKVIESLEKQIATKKKELAELESSGI
jgi:hypothetical protein